MKSIKLFPVIIFMWLSLDVYAQDKKMNPEDLQNPPAENVQEEEQIEDRTPEEELQKQPQENKKPPKQKSSFLKKVFIGGGFGAGFGSYTFINIAPVIGYRITPKLSAGLRLMYQYTTFDYFDLQSNKTKKYKGNDFGVGVYSRLRVFGPVFLQAEYERLSYDALYLDGSGERTNFNSFMAGGGIAQSVGGKVGVFLTVLYNFSYDGFDQSNVWRFPYNSPWVVRIGINAGF